MESTQAWLSLTDLGSIYGISATHCGRALQSDGWRNPNGLPTSKALKAGATCTKNHHKISSQELWNAEICKEVLEKAGLQPLSRTKQIEQWTFLLEALNEGSPSINTTAAQMAEELPKELVREVNDQLALRGCCFRV